MNARSQPTESHVYGSLHTSHTVSSSPDSQADAPAAKINLVRGEALGGGEEQDPALRHDGTDPECTYESSLFEGACPQMRAASGEGEASAWIELSEEEHGQVGQVARDKG